ncbi:unnamed protein product, partial [Rangifer tarandus platyrhynchus]
AAIGQALQSSTSVSLDQRTLRVTVSPRCRKSRQAGNFSNHKVRIRICRRRDERLLLEFRTNHSDVHSVPLLPGSSRNVLRRAMMLQLPANSECKEGFGGQRSGFDTAALA